MMLSSIGNQSSNQTLRLVDRNRLVAQRLRVIPNEKLISNPVETTNFQHNLLENLWDLQSEFDINTPNTNGNELLEISNSQMSDIFRDFSDNQNTICKEETRKPAINYKIIKGSGFYSCESCPFLCLNVKLFLEHNEKDHNFHHLPLKSLLKTKCIGCDNVFYSVNVLRCHLIEDHDVLPGEIEEMVQLVIEANKEETLVLENGDMPRIDNNLDDINDTILDDHQFDLQSQFEEPQKQTTEDNNFKDNNCHQNETLVTFWDSQQVVFSEYQDTSNIINDSNSVDKPFRCTFGNCKLRFRSEENLKYHKHCHSDDGFRCNEFECQFTDRKWTTMMSHLWKTHNIDIEMFSCDKCNFKTNSLYKLNSFHKNIHQEERPFLCTECGKGFKSVKQLRNHKIIHTKSDKPLRTDLTCLHCSQTFSSKSLLHQHISSIHNKARPFSCDVCGYKTAVASSLRLHMRSHTGEKPFKCDECGFCTADHNTLRKHKMRHTGQKNYTCPHCSYSCIQATSYKKHLNTKHPGLDDGFMYSCDMCKFKTIRKDIYMLHIVRHKEEILQKNGVCEPLVSLQEVVNSKEEIQVDNTEQSYLFNMIRVKPLDTLKPNEVLY
ncbi:zinc finger protein 595-like [Adelges cooleyi]|uniref:zinc finger protein 595-like n=1 Tax=Adelges cooleyi TaxID=133065 RepID=UPI00217F90E5|nr:zinc finger protein 595-like [Adelges cooleyi]